MNEMDMILVNCIKDNVKCLSLMDYNGKVLSPLVKDISTEPSSVTFASGLSGYSGLGSSGDYMIAAHNNNTMINISYLNRSKTLLQCRLQESLTSVVVDSMGIYLYGGTKQGNIYMWELGTGRVIKIWQAHWKTVHRLCITQDNHLLITGSEDGTVKIWDISSLFYSTDSHPSHDSNIVPFKTLNSHALPLTDMKMNSTGMSFKLYTVSQDRALCIWSPMESNHNVMKVVCPDALTSVVLTDNGDYTFCGSTNGDIYVIMTTHSSLLRHNQHQNQSHIFTAHNSLSTDITNTMGSDNPGEEDAFVTLYGHSRAVISLLVAPSQSILVSGSEDCTVRLWDIASLQCTRVVDSGLGDAVHTLIHVSRDDEGVVGKTMKSYTLPIAHVRKFEGSNDEGEGHYLAPMLLSYQN